MSEDAGATARGHFGGVAAEYAAFRPHYPPALYEHLASLVARRELAWDCGTGSGQAALDLGAWFERVVATDVSEAQLARAPRVANVGWVTARAEAAPIAAAAADLIVVAQALHWFQHDAFYDEVRRIAAPGALFAAWSYGPAWVEGAAATALSRFERETLGPYWPPERQHVYDGYRTLPFPFTELSAPRLTLEADWTLPELLGYARSWSATARYVAAHLADPVIELERSMASLWPAPDSPRRVVWPLTLRIGRVRDR